MGLCRDIAYKTGSKATMTAIKRTKSGDFIIDNALSPEEIKLLGEKAIIPVEKVLEKLPRVDFPENLYKKISCGVAFEYDKVTEQPFTVYCKGEFFGLGQINVLDEKPDCVINFSSVTETANPKKFKKIGRAHV